MNELAIMALMFLMLVLGFSLGRLWQWVESEPGMTEDEAVGMEAQVSAVEQLRDELCGASK